MWNLMRWIYMSGLPLPEQVKAYPGLPKVAYVYMLQSQGLMHDTYVYGVDAKKILPTLIYPTEGDGWRHSLRQLRFGM